MIQHYDLIVGSVASVYIKNGLAYGKTLDDKQKEIPVKLASLAICDIMLWNTECVNFVKSVSIIQDVLYYECVELKRINYSDEHKYTKQIEKGFNKLEETVLDFLGSYRWLDYYNNNYGLYNNNVYCFDALYGDVYNSEQLRKIERYFELEVGVLSKYHNAE